MERNSREITLRPSGLQSKKRAKLTYISIETKIPISIIS